MSSRSLLTSTQHPSITYRLVSPLVQFPSTPGAPRLSTSSVTRSYPSWATCGNHQLLPSGPVLLNFEVWFEWAQKLSRLPHEFNPLEVPISPCLCLDHTMRAAIAGRCSPNPTSSSNSKVEWFVDTLKVNQITTSLGSLSPILQLAQIAQTLPP